MKIVLAILMTAVIIFCGCFNAQTIPATPVNTSDYSATTAWPTPVIEVETGMASDVTDISARLFGFITFNTSPLFVAFEWGTSPGIYDHETESRFVTSTGSFNLELVTLLPNTTYYYRAKAAGDRITYGKERSFKSLSFTPPVVVTEEATGVDFATATMNGSISFMGNAATLFVSFRWGATPGKLENQFTGWEMYNTGSFYGGLRGLTSGKTYYYKAEIQVYDGKRKMLSSFFGEEKSFTTLSSSTKINTLSASEIDFTSAVLNGRLAALNTAGSTGVFFRWGKTSGKLNGETPAQPLSAAGNFSYNLKGLEPYTRYYFQAAVADSTEYGVELSFTTRGTAPSVSTQDASYITGNSAQLNGNLTSLGTGNNASIVFEWGTTAGKYSQRADLLNMKTTGYFNHNITGLSPGTTYYYRAVAGGHGTTNGNEKSFTTPGI